MSNCEALYCSEASSVLEIGDGREFVPLHCLLAEVKVFESECDPTQKEVLSQWLSTEHAQLKLSQAQSLLAVAIVDKLEEEEEHRSALKTSETV